MADNFHVSFDAGELRKHPEVQTVEDVITFRLQRLVAIGERAGQDWSQRMFDLSLNEWRLLALVKGRAPARAGGLADVLLMDKSQTSRVTKSLLNKGLIRSFPDPDDGRAIALEPTEEGVVLYRRVFAEVMRSNERILDVLSIDEVQALDVILRKLTEHSSDLLEARLGRPLIR
ncbi:MarR family winged helix-turn-helix transcriptional regulator [Sulfitobacter pacificus]|uniref:MarR family winged helix-turn-helix transcriptional regulator n=1 Tax=Sulfitobacter pacificus TaxID=1499314 RepID=UPI003107CA33